MLLLTISGSALLEAFIVLIVVALIFWLLWWAIAAIGVPEPFAKVLRAIIVIAAVIFLVNALLTLIGVPFIRWSS